ncbi:hypothetical protein COB57_05710 [Candidatus Peregrinibacteria bacterium]|nr:MAG: hypothetical protein COB57_05710 [Candidatus Peregrinibacteria bacterium]
MTTSDKILEYIIKNQPVSPKELTGLGVSRAMIHRHLKKLQTLKKIIKKGIAPHVFYFSINKPQQSQLSLAQEETDFIEEHFIYFEPSGNILKGVFGFIRWALKRNVLEKDLIKTATEYIKTVKKFQRYKGKDGLINGLPKLQKTFSQTFVDELYYCDFYSIERFGKTYLGNMLLYAKQGQNKKLMKEIAIKIQPSISDLIQKHNISAIGFIPHSIQRNVQLLEEIEKQLHIPLPSIHIIKISGEVAIAQKTLSKLQDRIDNAKNTLFVKEPHSYDTILLIDDAVGSGATLNEITKKVKEKNIAKKVIALAITGSFKGFEVLSEI